MASISQDYWGDIKEDWESGTSAGSRGGAPVGGLKLKLYFVKLHIIFALKIQ